ncbi:MAG: phosphotransferase family protein [Gammaproteobacteria bacterium]|nr:phosphotransferase family protein [Gammaproteobacteria bacterium]
MSQAEIEKVFSCLPLLKDFAPEDFEITPLAGLTNHNFRLQNPAHDWVLRIPKSKTNRYIDRGAEAHNQSLAFDLGIAPQASWRDSAGITLTPTLNSSRALRAADFDSDKLLSAILAPIQRLHRSQLRFRGKVDLNDLLHRFYEILGQAEQQSLWPRMRQAERVLSLLEARDSSYVASHNDLVLDNLLLDNKRIWLIDWEFSAMASPYWDLATICNAANLGLEQSQRLLRTYCAGARPMDESVLFDYRGLQRLLSDCWMAAFAD